MPTVEQIRKLAAELKLEPALVQAVCLVEANGSGFLPPGAKSPAGRVVAGLPKILFEPHVYWQRLKAQRPSYNPAGLLTRDDVRRIHGDISDLIYERWGTRPYGSTNAQWDRLERARAICRPAADESASWGSFQILGQNWQALGYKSVAEFVEKMHSTEGQQEAFVRFLQVNKLVPFLQAKDWHTFARRYNGPKYATHGYHIKLAAAYEKAVKEGFNN